MNAITHIPPVTLTQPLPPMEAPNQHAVALAYIEEVFAAMDLEADKLPPVAWAIVRKGIMNAGRRLGNE